MSYEFRTILSVLCIQLMLIAPLSAVADDKEAADIDTLFFTSRTGLQKLAIDKEHLFIVFESGLSVTEKKSFLRNYSFLAPTPGDEILSANGLYASFTRSLTFPEIYEIMRILREDERVQHISPSFQGIYYGYLNTFYAQVEPEKEKKFKETLKELGGSCYAFGEWPNAFYVKLDKHAKGDAIEVGRYLHKMGLVNWVEIEFIYQDEQLSTVE